MIIKMITLLVGEYRHCGLITDETGKQEFCAESHCRGECGRPALFLRWYYKSSSECSKAIVDEDGRYYEDYKLHGTMVACGPMWQAKRWDGERVYLKRDDEEARHMIRKNWWW